MTNRILNLLTIAGSDSGGGAGIQADLKTFSALGAYGASVITALTAQNTRGVHAIEIPSVDFVTAQLDAVFADIRIDAVKIGMLANADIVRAVADSLRRYRPAYVILDTVMVAKSGHALLAPDAVIALRDTLMPLATLITPNLPEAAALLAESVATDETDMVRQGKALCATGAHAVLIKGGHLGGSQSPDWLIEANAAGQLQETRLTAARIAVPNTHGTGCTLSAAIAALAPQRATLIEAVRDAKAYLSKALVQSTRLTVSSNTDSSIGPVHHFHAWW